MSETYSIKASKVSKTYNEHCILNDIDFSISEGERVGLIGRNGAGKTTLLKLISGIEDCSSGSIDIKGKVTAILSLGLGLREELTGIDNIRLEADVRGIELSDLMLKEIIEFSELGDAIEAPVRTFSTGMKSRLSFSILCSIQPEILIIDEVLSAGDYFFANKATKKIIELCNQGSILILVAHSIDTINQFCDRCILLENGSIKEDGVARDVTKKYKEAVFADVEQKDLEYFSSKVFLSAGYSVNLCFFSPDGNGSDEPVKVVELDAPLRIEVWGDKTKQPCIATFRLSRIDGLPLQQKQLMVPEGSSFYKFEVLYKQFSFYNGKYVIELTLESSTGQKLAEGVEVIETYGGHISGGVPIVSTSGAISLENVMNTREIG